MCYHGVIEKDGGRRFASEGEAMHISQDRASASYGCIFCKTGREMALVKELSRNVHSAEFLVAQKKSRRRVGGMMNEETVIMFPGYIFFRTYETVDLAELTKYADVLKLLSDNDGRWQMAGDDFFFAEWIFSQGGVIGFSDALVVDGKLKIIDGPLMGREEQIIKVNRRFHCCLALLKFNEREFRVWLGYDIVQDNVGTNNRVGDSRQG